MTQLQQKIEQVNTQTIQQKKKYALKPQALAIYDNNGKTFDRYTVVIGTNVYGMSVNPRSPLGFNQYCCEVSEVNNFNLGTKRLLHELPKEVRLAIAERLDL